MNSVMYENQILDAIETITQNVVAQTGYNRTIQATIVKMINEITGEYIVKYQDSDFIVYAGNTNIQYPEGTLVNVLIPNGDFTFTKTILNAVENDKIEYSSFTEEEDKYINTSNNLITATQNFGICSYKGTDKCILYDVDSQQNNINIDIKYLETHIKENDSILCGASFQTDLDLLQRKNGNYGITFELEFLNSATQETVVNQFTIDINQMQGDPYNLSSFVRQYKTFKINTKDFIRIKSIYLFCENFAEGVFEEYINDIFAKDFEFSLLQEIQDEDFDSYELNIVTKNNKKYFDDYDLDTSTIVLSTELTYNKQNIQTNIDYYWFKENPSIKIESDKYSIIGGTGWECLNPFNETDNGIEYVSMNEYTIVKTDIVSKDIRFKCVGVKDGKNIASQIITISNISAQYELSINSDEGTSFYFDQGCPNLKCLINNQETILDGNTYTYKWGYIDANNIYHSLDETTEENEIYNEAFAQYQELMTRIETGLAMEAASQEELDRELAIINLKNQRVEANCIYNLDLTKFIGKAIFKCAVIQNNSVLLGTATLELTNSYDADGEYHLQILNGTQTFHYTINGTAPTNASLDKPLQLEPLSFIIYDNQGKLLAGDALNSCEIEWIVPKEHTLLIAQDGYEKSLTYQLADKYSEQDLYNNTIELTVIYKGMTLRANTAFTFSKDGDPGVNGTDLVCRIVPNVIEDPAYEWNSYPMVVNGSFNFGCLDYEKTENYYMYQKSKWFRIQIWKEGELVFDGADSTEDVTIDWSILQNKYDNYKKDESSIQILKTEDNDYEFVALNYLSDGADIVKATVTYKDVVYYALFPVINVNIIDLDDNYSISVENNSGFRFVKYGEDGKNPLYSNTIPFTLKVTKEIDGFIEDISTIDNEYSLTYDWSLHGQIYRYEQQEFINSLDCSFSDVAGLQKNQKFVKPNDKYDGQNVTNAIEVVLSKTVSRTQGGQEIEELQEIGRIHIPLYLFLDRYGHSAINGWDGNSILLREDGGVILAPQIGAGHKEVDNSFTGLLMGSAKEQEDKMITGLLGYHYGERTLFLDSESGKAEFGRVGSGQIIIDPGDRNREEDPKALLYGGNYIEANPEQGVQGSGLLIDLAKPEIVFGNKNFLIDSQGRLVATEADIKGNIKALTGYFGSAEGTNKIKIGDDTTVNYSYIYSGDKINIDAPTTGFYLGTNGLALGAPSEGEEDQGSPFRVTAGGVLTAKRAEITGEINATSGKIGAWSIDNGSIRYGDDFYLSSDKTVKFGKFTVDNNGEVQAEGIQITGAQFTKGSIILEGNNEECKNGVIVGEFDFLDPNTYTKPRNCVGKDSIVCKGTGADGSYIYSKMTPGRLVFSNANGTRKLTIDTTDNTNTAITLDAPNNNTSFEIKRNGTTITSMSATEVYAPAIRSTSLESMKKNITLEENCLEDILNTDIMSYNLKFEDDTDHKHIGMIIPDEGGPYRVAEKALNHDRNGVDLYSAIMMAWKAIQELNNKIEEKKGD